jgi:hypothetical protein
MFNKFLAQWEKEKQQNLHSGIIKNYGEAFAMTWSFYFFLGKELRLSNKDYQDLILDIVGPRMFADVDRSNYNQVLSAIEKECAVHELNK